MELNVVIGAISIKEGVISVILKVHYLNESKTDDVHDNGKQEDSRGDIGSVDPVAVVEFFDKA
jgi:hypothetical protein